MLYTTNYCTTHMRRIPCEICEILTHRQWFIHEWKKVTKGKRVVIEDKSKSQGEGK